MNSLFAIYRMLRFLGWMKPKTAPAKKDPVQRKRAAGATGKLVAAAAQTEQPPVGAKEPQVKPKAKKAVKKAALSSKKAAAKKTPAVKAVALKKPQ